MRLKARLLPPHKNAATSRGKRRGQLFDPSTLMRNMSLFPSEFRSLWGASSGLDEVYADEMEFD